ncbi:substrate-binding periplasmic protein [Tamilnaduibacter salinus]|uniref:substrate-binding periplasmic protein n=1 Tax=Tamilnaduibacter salinus TaxID=1484056 RepID=UPI001303F42C|nr:transporter substrate-binding domain-containing protein [Tamilnaduibacter salinus]
MHNSRKTNAHYGSFKRLRCLLVLALSLAVPVQAEEPLTLLTGVWPPFVNPEKGENGVMTEVVMAAFASINQPVRIERLPWNRVRRATDKEGAVSFGWSWGRDTNRDWYHSDTLMTSKDVFAVRRGADIEWQSISQLTGYRIGVVRGYHLPSGIEDLRDDLNIVVAPRDESLLRMLLADRLDLAVTNPRVARHVMNGTRRDERGEIRLLTDRPIGSYSLHLTCHKNTPDCAQTVLRFNEGLRRIRDDGTWARITEEP